MREIKFRAWDKIDKKMFSPACATVASLNDPERLVENDYAQYMHERKNVEIMQYTGIKDKHGQEIYEGDILGPFKCISGSQKTLKVAWIEKSVSFGLLDTLGIYPLPFQTLNNDKKFDYTFDYPVIGNIYENPELFVSLFAKEATNDRD